MVRAKTGVMKNADNEMVSDVDNNGQTVLQVVCRKSPFTVSKNYADTKQGIKCKGEIL